MAGRTLAVVGPSLGARGGGSIDQVACQGAQEGGHRTGAGDLLEVGALKIPDVVHERDLAGNWVAHAG